MRSPDPKLWAAAMRLPFRPMLAAFLAVDRIALALERMAGAAEVVAQAIVLNAPEYECPGVTATAEIQGRPFKAVTTCREIHSADRCPKCGAHNPWATLRSRAGVRT